MHSLHRGLSTFRTDGVCSTSTGVWRNQKCSLAGASTHAQTSLQMPFTSRPNACSKASWAMLHMTLERARAAEARLSESGHYRARFVVCMPHRAACTREIHFQEQATADARKTNGGSEGTGGRRARLSTGQTFYPPIFHTEVGKERYPSTPHGGPRPPSHPRRPGRPPSSPGREPLPSPGAERPRDGRQPEHFQLRSVPTC